jgi:hypothetical protein
MVVHTLTPVFDNVDFAQVGPVSVRGSDRNTWLEKCQSVARCLVALAGGIPVYVVP